MKTIGIDIGSSFLKSAVFSLEERRILSGRSVPSFPRRENPDPAYYEISAEDIYQTVKKLIDEAAAQHTLDGILLSTQMHGFVYRIPGREDIYVSWQDSRCLNPLPSGKSALDTLKGLLPGEILKPCGVPLKPSLGLCNLYALLHGKNPPPADGELFTLGSYLIWRLTGQNRCHITNAAPLGLVDVTRGEYSVPVLERTGLTQINLPEIVCEDFTCCGAYHVHGQNIPVFPDYGDQQVCVLGSMAPKGAGVVNIATASQVSCNTDRFVPGEYEVRPFFEHTYLNTISNMPGGRNLAVLLDFFRACAKQLCGREISVKDAWSALQNGAGAKTDGLKVDSLFYPTQTKFDGGKIENITPDNFTPGGVLAAAYEDMARIYAEHLPKVCGGSLPKSLAFLGGVSYKNKELLNVISRRTGLSYRSPTIKNEATGGLYRLSLAALGQIKSLQDCPENILREGL